MNNILSIFIFLLFFIVAPIDENNEITGTITASDCRDFVVRGNGYNKDGTEILHSDDPLTKPERNIIISMHPLDFEPELNPSTDAYISQSEQTFIPHILPIVVGSKVHFLNEDEFFHNVQSRTSKARFSIGRRAPGVSYTKTIKKVGAVELSCDIHAHMNAKILSFDTPYFTRVEADGTYTIKHLPDGRYRLEIFHPTCDKLIEEIALKGGQVFTRNFQLFNKA